ncbi:bactofilin family protein [Leptotrichia trevisanii]|uniref:bactofilin family protein n=1 Tax=Leptotrichia trevisanii TaxID=109328 RepID=UPI000407DDA9|nr:polymer-forming cytoskeletal protein [Leptotrichia trevisanii]
MAIFSSNKPKEKRETTDLSKQFSANNEENVHGVSTISMETTITGTIESNSLFKMDGVLNGDIKGNKLVHIGKTGMVKGNVTAENVIVDGEVSGEIAATKVEIGSTGKAYATITSALFVIQEGGVFEGRKKMKVALIKEESKNTSNSSSVEKNEKKADEEVTKAKNEK